MTTTIQRFRKYLLFGILLAFVSLAYKGCELFPESTFQLSSESRLPKWITLPPGLTRADVSLAMSYYIFPWGRSAQFVLRDKNQRVIQKENGKLKCGDPLKLENPPQGSPTGYPAYEAITVNGMTEIIEHKKPEPIFYVTDDIAVRKQIESIGC